MRSVSEYVKSMSFRSATHPSCLGEGHEPTAAFVPQLEPHRPEPVPQRKRWHPVEDRILLVGALQVVVGDACVEVVHVMEADVAGEELKHPRQAQVGAATQRRFPVTPVLGTLPV